MIKFMVHLKIREVNASDLYNTLYLAQILVHILFMATRASILSLVRAQILSLNIFFS